jgi:uncharacterized membrane protein
MTKMVSDLQSAYAIKCVSFTMILSPVMMIKFDSDLHNEGLVVLSVSC